MTDKWLKICYIDDKIRKPFLQIDVI